MEQSPTKKINIKVFFGRFITVRGIAEMAVLVALAIIFDQKFLKISFNSGASISLTMLPLIIIALRFPFLDSFLGIGVIYGFITTLTDGYGIQYFPLDYLLAYGSLSLVSLFRPLIFAKYKFDIINYLFLVIAIVPAVFLRIIWSTISGILMWESPSFAASFLYNAPPMAVSALIVLILLFMLFQTLVVYNKQLVTSYTVDVTVETTEELPNQNNQLK